MYIGKVGNKAEKGDALYVLCPYCLDAWLNELNKSMLHCSDVIFFPQKVDNSEKYMWSSALKTFLCFNFKNTKHWASFDYQ